MNYHTLSYFLSVRSNHYANNENEIDLLESNDHAGSTPHIVKNEKVRYLVARRYLLSLDTFYMLEGAYGVIN